MQPSHLTSRPVAITRAAAMAAAVAMLAPVAAGAADPTFGDPRAMKFPELGAIQIPKPDRVTLKNGMVVYLLQDHDLPMVQARALIRVGAIYDPDGRAGLADMTGEVMRTGGSITVSGDALDQELESMGARVEVSVGQTQGNATVSALSEDAGRAFDILADVLRHPAFPPEKIELARKHARRDIASRNDEPGDIFGRELLKLIYGPDHPYARHTEYATIDAITRDDMVRFHDQYFHPDRIILTVYGDFDPGRIQKTIEKAFGDWPKSTQPLPPDPAVVPSKISGTFLIDKGDMTNSFVAVAHEGMRMDDPDYPAMDVYNQVMGGGFSSRLFNEIRDKRGLAYAAGGTIGAGYNHPLPLLFYVATQADSTVTTLNLLKQEIDRSLKQPFGDDEIQRAKDALLNSLVFQYASKFDVENRLAEYEFYGYPRDFLQRYQEAVKKVTAADVQAAARRKIRYPAMATLVVGTTSSFAAALPALGEYKTIDITIPPPRSSALPAASEGDLARGRELLRAAVTAMGGEAAAAVKDLTLEQSSTVSIQGMQLAVSGRVARRLPDCIRVEQTLPMGTMVQAACGGQGWTQAMGKTQPMPAEMMKSVREDVAHDMLTVLRGWTDLKPQALPGKVEVGGRPCDVLFIPSDLVADWKIYVDPENHRIARMDYRGTSIASGGPAAVQEIYGDYREVSGLQWPYQTDMLQDGEKVVTTHLTRLVVNGGVEPTQFEMPAP